jgi:hypothetical protein
MREMARSIYHQASHEYSTEYGAAASYGTDVRLSNLGCVERGRQMLRVHVVALEIAASFQRSGHRVFGSAGVLVRTHHVADCATLTGKYG